MSCSRTQHGGGRSRTPDLSLRSPTLYHWATALPLPCFALKFAPWHFVAVVCKCFSDKVNSFAYRCHDLPERTEMDWSRQKRTCESRNWLFIVKESWNFGNYIKIWSQIENKYGMSWIYWFQVFFNTLHQHKFSSFNHFSAKVIWFPCYIEMRSEFLKV